MGSLGNTNARLVTPTEPCGRPQRKTQRRRPTRKAPSQTFSFTEGSSPLPACHLPPCTLSPFPSPRVWHTVINHGSSCHSYQPNSYQLSPGLRKGEDGVGSGDWG